MDFDHILEETCSSEDLKMFEERFNAECMNGPVAPSTQFEYACFLVKSKYPADIQKGIFLLEDLYKNPNEVGKRDYVYYLALGNARIKNYKDALRYADGLLKVEPGNRQVSDLQTVIKKKMEREALKGAAVVGGVVGGGVLVLGALVGMALSRR